MARSLRKAWLLAVGLAACSSVPLHSTDRESAATKPSRQLRAIDDTHEDFNRLNALRRDADREVNLLGKWNVYRSAWQNTEPPLRDYIAQVMAAIEAQLGLYDEALRDYPIGRPATKGNTAGFPDSTEFTPVPAADAISELAHARQLVFINEAHHDAHTRELTLDLLPRLRAQGFTHFAAETLDEKDRELAQRGHAVVKSGYYSDEAVYGEILRTALRLGYIVVPYESADGKADRRQREHDQAENLYRRVFAKTPHARLLVHAGYAHVHKAKGYLWETEPLAMQLGARLHSDPLSIDQTLLRPNAGKEYAAWPLLIDAYAPREPVVLRHNVDRHIWSLEPQTYDVSVILPRNEPRDGRPAWLELGGLRRRVAVDAALCRETLPCLIEARYADESLDAVPADRWLQLPDATPAPLYLFPGRYRLRAVDTHGTLLEERNLDVSDK